MEGISIKKTKKRKSVRELRENPSRTKTGKISSSTSKNPACKGAGARLIYRGSKSSRLRGTNDAFVLIQMGKEKFQTTVQEKATDPEWYEECDLTLIGRDSDVSLTVYHRNILGLEEFLGQTSISLRGIESFDRPFTK
ncbi:c2 domain-containing protein [Trichonephila clavipes]|nr:c2 domain-containing protein [Trichonephila clavipes]